MSVLHDICMLIYVIICFAGFLVGIIALSDTIGDWLERKIATNQMRRAKDDKHMG